VYEMHKLQALHQRQKMVSPWNGMLCGDGMDLRGNRKTE
jgi:hypothetical protein